MAADAHTTVVVEQLHAAHLEKLVITLSPVPLPAVGQYPPSKHAVLGASSEHPCPDPANLPINAPTPQPCHQHASVAQPGQHSRPTKVLKAAPQRTARGNFAGGADGAVAPSASGVAQPRSTLRRSIMLVAAVTAWYTANIGLILTNRHLLSSGFEQPVFLTLIHMVASGLMPAGLAHLRGSPREPTLSAQHLRHLAVLAAVFSSSVVLGNVALRYIPVSFFQAVCATTPAFVAALAMLLFKQRESRGVCLALLPVIAGLVLATGAEPSFDAVGFTAVIAATVLRALKTVLQALLLKDVQPTVVLRHMALMASVLLLIATAALERDVLAALPPWASSRGFYVWLAINCSFAFATNISNFIVIKYTSPLTMQVLGNLMGVCGTAISIIIFRNDVSTVALCGYGMTMAGVCLYGFEKHRAATTAAALGRKIQNTRLDTT